MCDISVSDAKSVLPWTSLSAASDPVIGTAVDLGGVASEFTLHTIKTGSPSTATVALEGSLDGTNWYSLSAPMATVNTGGVTGVEVRSNLVMPYGNDGGSGNTPIARSLAFARHVRANLTAISGGTSPTVTAIIAVGRVT